MNWVTIVLGAALFLAPFVTGYSGTPMALWTNLVMGAVIAVLGYKQWYKWAAGAGLVTLVAPWVLGFGGVIAAMWSCLILGCAVALLAGYRGFFAARNAQTSSNAQHHAV